MSITKYVVLTFLLAGSIFAQNPAQKIYETERAFEKMVAEKGIRAGFIEYLTADAVMFMPDVVNGRDTWKARPESPAVLTWNPILIDVSSNGIMAFSIGNSVYRTQGKDDPTGYHGHYISVWTRQPNNDYRVSLDTGINHDKPAATSRDWKIPPGSGVEKNERRISAADSATGFYQTIESGDSGKALKQYFAEDVVVMREGLEPIFGKKAAIEHLLKEKGAFKFAKIKSFMESADMAYVHGPYSVTDKTGKTTERGNYVQIWKLRNEKWLTVADVRKPVN